MQDTHDTTRKVRKQMCAQQATTCSWQPEGVRGHCGEAGLWGACTCSRHSLRPLPSCPLTCLWVSAAPRHSRGYWVGGEAKEVKGQTPSTEALPPMGLGFPISSGSGGNLLWACQAQVLLTDNACHL